MSPLEPLSAHSPDSAGGDAPRLARQSKPEPQRLSAFLALRFPAQASLVVAYPAPEPRYRRLYDRHANRPCDAAAEIAYAANIGHAPNNDVPEAVREQFAYSRRTAKGRALANRMLGEARA